MSRAGAVDAVERGRDAYARRAWSQAYDSLTAADAAAPLEAEDVERLAWATLMLGRDDEALLHLERAHHAYAQRGENLRAARSAAWIGINSAYRGDMGRATGWLGRAQRLVDREGRECPEQGYLLLPRMFQQEAMHDYAGAAETARRIAEIGERFGDPDLIALGRQGEGMVLTEAGRIHEGLALLDENMVALTAGELSPFLTGMAYCAAILACQSVYEVGRAREWTEALTRWCEQQPDLVAFTGRCLVHRAELMQLDGAWREALQEARLAERRFEETANPAVGLALYREGELHRLQGDFAAAEEAYRQASRRGWEPQPGLAQLRLAQGRADAAAASIRRASAETTDPLKRLGLLPAYVEIMLGVGEAEEARSACRELDELAGRYESAMLSALVAQARGSVELADGDPRAALVSVRRAWQLWHELGVPYDAARTRLLVASACHMLGDDDAAALELEAARAVFEQLGAKPDLARLGSLAGSSDTYGLTPRELDVLRLLAAGKSNRDIAAELVISEHTAARHVQNIFAKLRVSSRAAAAAFALRHGLA